MNTTNQFADAPATDADTKQSVADFWNEGSCGTELTQQQKYSKEYFEEIEAHRYEREPEIFSFAQFPRFRGQKVLEVGVGAGTDFLQWVRVGALAHGMDLTEEAIQNVEHRLDVYGLKAEDLRLGDAENIPYDDDFFDLVYSWGVIHHTPNTPRAFEEIVRVTRPGGHCKIMIYHRRSLGAFYWWLRYGLMVGKPWRSFSWCLYHHMESVGTKAYTPREAKRMLRSLPVKNIRIRTSLTYYDKWGGSSRLRQRLAKLLAYALGGDRVGWFLLMEFDKKPVSTK